MAKTNKSKNTKVTNRTTAKVSAPKIKAEEKNTPPKSFAEKIQYDLENNQSYLNFILGALIVIVLGILLYNYFTKPKGDVTPDENANQIEQAEGEDVAKENLPGTYNVKDGDTLFMLAEKYYGDGNLYPSIIKENNLPSEIISTGQKLTIPKVNEPSPSPNAAGASPSPESSPTPSPLPEASSSSALQTQTTPEEGTGGADNQTAWGEKITGDTYTVKPGDWLSTIAGRAYGDIYAYDKIAKENNITDPNVIEVGTVLKLPK